jgi:hypothetical protein
MYHVITFSETGDALTPAGGSDCILWKLADSGGGAEEEP